METLRTLPRPAQRWYVGVTVGAIVAGLISIGLSPSPIAWWQVLVLGLAGGLLTLITAPMFADGSDRQRVTTSHGAVISTVVLILAGPTSALLINTLQYGIVQLGESTKQAGLPLLKWWFNLAATTVSMVVAWLIIASWGLTPGVSAVATALTMNLINAALVIVMVALVRTTSVTDQIRTSWRQLLWANTDSALVTHYATLVWLYVPWLIMTVPLVILTRGHLARLVSQMVDRAAIEAELAQRDGLTGLYNRRALDQQLNQIPAHQQSMALFLIDIDHFKTVNDRAGHLAGDDVLRAVAHCIQQHVPADAFVSRYGGEELCVVVSRIGSADRATELAERLRLAIAHLMLDVIDTSGIPMRLQITVSIGISHWPQGGEPARMIQAADRAVYQAKRAGRNQVRLAEAVSIVPTRDLDPAAPRLNEPVHRLESHDRTTGDTASALNHRTDAATNAPGHHTDDDTSTPRRQAS